METMSLNELSHLIIEVALEIHRRLGPGLLESVYQAVMTHELRKRGLQVTTEVPVPVEWDGLKLEVGFRIDLLVEEQIVVELKSTEGITPVFKKKLLTYLRLMDKRIGLLINFHEVMLKNGIHRVVNEFDEKAG